MTRTEYVEKRLDEMRENPYDRAHGTITGYNYGCRCPYCGWAMSEYNAKYYRRHSTRIKKRNRRYYKAHKDDILAKRKERRYEAAVKRWAGC